LPSTHNIRKWQAENAKEQIILEETQIKTNTPSSLPTEKNTTA
jgi:hypothetical protein